MARALTSGQRMTHERQLALIVRAIGAALQRMVDRTVTTGDALRALSSMPIEATLAAFEASIGALLESAGVKANRAAERQVQAAKRADDTLEERLQIVDQLAQDYASTQAGQLISRIGATARETIRDTIATAIRENMTIDELKREIRLVVGHTVRDARALGRMRRELRADGLKADVIERRIARRSEVMLNRRARTIARTEMQTAMNEARAVEWDVAVSNGELPSTMRRAWVAKDPCPVCIALAANDPVGLNEPFIDDDGNEIMRPPAHVNCKCSVVLVRA